MQVKKITKGALNDPVCTCIVLAGGYGNNVDRLNELVYTGMGANDYLGDKAQASWPLLHWLGTISYNAHRLNELVYTGMGANDYVGDKAQASWSYCITLSFTCVGASRRRVTESANYVVGRIRLVSPQQTCLLEHHGQ